PLPLPTPTPIYTLSLHDALPIYSPSRPHEERSSPKAPEQPHIGRFYDSQFLTSVEIVGCILADCRRAKTVTVCAAVSRAEPAPEDRKSTRLNSSHVKISYAVFCL